MWLLKRKSVERIEFCERCGSICDTSCRAEAQRDATMQSLLRHGVRIA